MIAYKCLSIELSVLMHFRMSSQFLVEKIVDTMDRTDWSSVQNSTQDIWMMHMTSHAYKFARNQRHESHERDGCWPNSTCVLVNLKADHIVVAVVESAARTNKRTISFWTCINWTNQVKVIKHAIGGMRQPTIQRYRILYLRSWHWKLQVWQGQRGMNCKVVFLVVYWKC